MKLATAFQLVLVTAPDRKTARRLAQAALRAKLVACANLVPGIESHYWWNDRIARGKEILILFKTRRQDLRALETLILAEHPYDTPEIITVGLAHGTPRYLAWLTDSLIR
jgi:periplasmic divalent cation tolerance protein